MNPRFLSKTFPPKIWIFREISLIKLGVLRTLNRLVDWGRYIRLLPKISDKRIQNIALNCQSFLCFLFSLSQSFNEYSVPGDFSHKHFWYRISSKVPTINHFLIWIVVYLATLSNIFNSCSLFFLLWTENNQIFCKHARFHYVWKQSNK